MNKTPSTDGKNFTAEVYAAYGREYAEVFPEFGISVSAAAELLSEWFLCDGYKVATTYEQLGQISLDRVHYGEVAIEDAKQAAKIAYQTARGLCLAAKNG